MFENDAELATLQALLDASIGRANPHLTSIVEPGRRTMTAQRLVAELVGVCVLNAATVTARGEPRLSAVDGHFLHGHWYFTTSATAIKARHLTARPAISVAYTPRDGLGVWAHGRVAFLERGTAEWSSLDEHLNAAYGESPGDWGEDIVFLRVDADWLVGFAMTDEELAEIEQKKREREQAALTSG